jgi:hypothetical protein
MRLLVAEIRGSNPAILPSAGSLATALLKNKAQELEFAVRTLTAEERAKHVVIVDPAVLDMRILDVDYGGHSRYRLRANNNLRRYIEMNNWAFAGGHKDLAEELMKRGINIDTRELVDDKSTEPKLRELADVCAVAQMSGGKLHIPNYGHNTMDVTHSIVYPLGLQLPRLELSYKRR